jgi:hypothetical protein
MPERSGVSRGVWVGRKDRPTRRPSPGQKSERGVYRVSYRVIPEEAESDTRYGVVGRGTVKRPSTRYDEGDHPDLGAEGRFGGSAPKPPEQG